MIAEPEQWWGCYDTPRDGLFTRESNRHPAKMAVGLCFRIIQHGEQRGYWKKGDTILDPMAGIGTTPICAMAEGYRAVCVELEEHFHHLLLQNLAHAAARIHPKHKPALPIRGDARELCALLSASASKT